MAITFDQLATEVARIGGIDDSDESAAGDAWTKGGLRAISRMGTFPWLKARGKFALSDGTFEYAFSANLNPAGAASNDIFRLDTKSFRYGGWNTYLAWERAERIDANLGPDWKDDSDDTNTPEYVTRFGNNIWIAQKPGASFVADYPHLHFYYWRSEPSTGDLYLPPELTEIAVDFALAYGWYQEDDPRAIEKQRICETSHRETLLGITFDVGFETNLRGIESFDAMSDYGEGIWK